MPLKYISTYLARRSVETNYALAEACLIGLVSAFAALFLKQGIGWVGSLRLTLVDSFGAALILPLGGLLMGIIAGWCLEIFSPAATGGGIPQVKAVLAQFSLPLSLRVALVKSVGTILVLGSGLTLGRRGPTVHIGAALAAQLSSWVPTSPEHRRQMIAAGAAAGLAAGFNTPIAGVMFVIEELMRDVSDLTLETAIIASFTGAVVSRLLGSADLNIPGAYQSATVGVFAAKEIPFYLLLGTLAGVLGAVFNRGILFSIDINRRLSLPMPWRMGGAGLISGAIVAFLPEFFQNNAGLRDFLMTGDLEWQMIAVVFVAHFCLTMIAYGSGAPGGLFAPALVLGFALGYLVGDLEFWLQGDESQLAYALAGMGGFFTAVVRVPVTAIVITFELTADFNLVLPLMIVCAVAYMVAETVFSGSIYQHLLKNIGIQLEQVHSNPQFLSIVTAEEVMQPRVETLPPNMNLEEVLQAFSRSSHHGFPVVQNQQLLGLITQQELANVVKRDCNLPLAAFMNIRPVTVRPEASLSDVVYLLNRYQLSHLPVIEENKLVGIITRSDVIRTEANHLSGEVNQLNSPSQNSYLVYLTHSPATGKGRILLPLANPRTANFLIKTAGAIARQENYEIECLQVTKVSLHVAPSQAAVRTTKSRRLLRLAEKRLRHEQIPVHTQIRFSHNVAQTILQVVNQRHIDIMLMGWKGATLTPGRIFGDVTDTIIQQAACDVVLIKNAPHLNLDSPQKRKSASWLIPFGGGPNSRRAIELIPALTSLIPTRRVCLCQVYPPFQSRLDTRSLDEAVQFLQSTLNIPVQKTILHSHAVADTLIHLARTARYDVVVLGATREGLLQQAIHGNIPQKVAKGIESTVILVRGNSEVGS